MKKHIFYIMSIVMCFLSVGIFSTNVSAAEFLDGDGSAENPYIIANKSHFYNALHYPNANFLLYTDLNFETDVINVFESFSGFFDGNNHKITLSTDTITPPVFGTLSGVVKNLTLSGNFKSASFATTLTSGGIISHCRNEGKCNSVYGNGSSGGIVVTCNGIIELSSNAGDIYGNTCVGGIAATCDGMIDRCYNTGNVTRYGTVGRKECDYLGGICGKGNNIVNCYNTGMIDGVYDNYNTVTRSAGIVGYSTKVVNCYNAGRIVGPMCGSIIAETSIFIETAEKSCSNCYYYNEDKLARYAPRAELGDINACYYTQLCQQNTFEEFDFESVWIIKSEDYLMPQLRNNLHIDRKNDTDNFCGGNGTFYNPFLISERKHLSNMEMYPAAYYQIVSDIDVGSWTTIFDNNIFWGVLDGNEHTLSNIEVKITKKDNKTSDSVAFMGSCYGIIRNLNISNSNFSVVVYTNYNSNYALAGTFAVNLNGKIENCKTLGTGTVSAHCCYDDDLGGSSLSKGWAYAGGIVARGQGKIINCENNFKVLSNNHSGGIISCYLDISSEFPTQKLSIEYCVNKGTIEVVNYNPETTILCCAGGIISSGEDKTTITGCINYATITSDNTYHQYNGYIYAGGIVGNNASLDKMIVDSCYNMGKINCKTNMSESYAGGIAGYGSVTNCFNNAKIDISTICTNYYDKPAFYIGGITGEGNAVHCYTLGGISYFWNGVSDECHYGDFSGAGTSENCLYLGASVYNSSNVNEKYCIEKTYTGFDFSNKWGFDPMIEYKYPIPLETLTIPSSIELEGGEDIKLETTEGIWPDFEKNIILKDKYENVFITELKTWMLPNINISKIGEQTSDIIYKSVSAPQKVRMNIVKKKPTKIEVSQMPTKIIYLKNEENFDATGGIITVYYDNLTSKDFSLSVADINGFDNSNKGVLELTVSYLGCQTKMNVEISEELSMSITRMPSKLTYVQSQGISLNGLVVETICNKGISRKINIADLEVVGNTNTIGTVTIVLKYKTFSTTFDINVIEKEISHADFVEPSDIIFYKGDVIEFKTGYIKVFYVSDDNYNETIPITSDLVKGYDENSLGYQKITIYLNDKNSWEMYINVKQPYVFGDLNGDDKVTDDDAIYLMYHIFFADDYPVEQDCDFNNDGKVTDDDVIYLMFHIFFPEEYPIN